MLNPTIDYQCVLQDLKARRDRLNVAIEAVQHIIGELQSTPSEINRVNIIPNGSDAYRRMTIKDAAVQFLRSTGSKQPTSAIAEALKQGGIRSKSKNLYTTVYNILASEAKREQGKVVRDEKSWELRERVQRS